MRARSTTPKMEVPLVPLVLLVPLAMLVKSVVLVPLKAPVTLVPIANAEFSNFTPLSWDTSASSCADPNAPNWGAAASSSKGNSRCFRKSK